MAAMYDRTITPSVNNAMDKYGNAQYVQMETRIGGDVVGPGFSEQLERFYKKAKPVDKARCLELLTAINIQKEVKSRQANQRSQTPGPGSFRNEYSTPIPPRPKTVMATSQEHVKLDKTRQCYQTTYKREYLAPDCPSVEEERPRSTKGLYSASYKLGGPIGQTTYGAAYVNPLSVNSSADLADYEFLRNNPHPNEAFMVWRFSKKQPEVPRKFPEGLTVEAMDKLNRSKWRSTYQADYLGCPQAFDISTAINQPEDWRSKVPYSLSSSMRYSYQYPNKQAELQSNLTRFGCNQSKGSAVTGAVPAVSRPHLHLKPRSTYDRDYIAPCESHVPDVREISKRLGADTLQRQIDMCGKEERETLKEMLKSIKSPTPPTGKRQNSKSKSASRRINSSGSPVDKAADFKPSWLSTWTGPM